MSFELATAQYRLQTSGVKIPVMSDSWTGHDVAAAITDTLSASGAAAPIVVGAIPFDPRSPACLYVPEEVTWSSPDSHTVAPDLGAAHSLCVDDEDLAGYRSSVDEALVSIRSGWMEKVVLARRRIVVSDTPFDPAAVFGRLVAGNPDAYVYRMNLSEPTGFSIGDLVGASPELVLASRADMVESIPLAGSIPRGSDEHSDQAAARSLLASRKDLDEHRHVTRSVREAFELFADEIVCPAEPELVPTPVIWHLGTKITGRLRPGVSPVELLYTLHPTPAVCGVPQKRAREMIHRLERFDRGMYAGLIGWIDNRGNSEWVLALRGGLLRGNQAVLTAGAGIVAASDPSSEARETEVKLNTIMAALGTFG